MNFHILSTRVSCGASASERLYISAFGNMRNKNMKEWESLKTSAAAADGAIIKVKSHVYYCFSFLPT